MTKSITKVITLSLLIALVVLLFSGCADLGAFEDKDDYYTYFGDIDFYSSELNTYRMNQLYNDDTVEKNESSPVETDKYRYICIELKKDIKIDTLSAFLITPTLENNIRKVDLSFNIYYVKSGTPDLDEEEDLISGVYRKYDSDETISFNGLEKEVTYKGKTVSYTFDMEKSEASFEVTYKINEGLADEQEITEKCTCGLSDDYGSITLMSDKMADAYYFTWIEQSPEVLKTKFGSSFALIGSAKSTFTTGIWDSFSVDDWLNLDGDTIPSYEFSQDTYIIIEILNNCSGGKKQGLKELSVGVSNVMIRAL